MKMENSKGLGPIVTTSLLLFVLIVAFLGLSVWYADLRSGMQSKYEQNNYNSVKGYLEVMGVEQVGSSYLLYVKSNAQGYSVVKSISVNSDACVLVGSNVVDGKSIGEILIDCSSFSVVNEVVFVTNSDIVQEIIMLSE